MRAAGNAYQNLQGPLAIGSPTGGFQTAGTINAQGLFVNGVAVAGGAAVSSVTGTANQVAASPTTGAVVVSLPQNVIIPTPAAGVALTATGVSGAQAASYNASGSTNVVSFTNAATTNRSAIAITQSGGNTALIGLDGTQQILSGSTNGDLCIRNAQAIKMSANGFVAAQFTLSNTGQLTIATSSTTDAITATAPTGTAPATADAGEIFVIKNTSTAGGDLRLLTFGQVGANAFIRPVLGGAGPAAAGLSISTSAGGTLFGAGGNVSINAPTSGVALSVTGVGGQFVQTLNPNGAALSSGLSIVGTFSGAGTTQLLLLADTANTNGANIQLTGNGANPNKFIRANAGNLQILNSAYSSTLLQIGDNGNTTVNSSGAVTAQLNSVGVNAQVLIAAPSTFAAQTTVAANGNAASAGVIVQQDTSSNAFIRNLGSGTMNIGVGATNYLTMSAAGNVAHVAPTSGVAVTITGFAGSSALQINTTGVQVGSPTGGDKGAGTINVSSGLFINNVAVGTGAVSSVTGTANQITASPTTGAVVLTLPQNVIVPTPAAGVALALTGVAGSSALTIATTGMQIGSPTGGELGAGMLNVATGLNINNQPVYAGIPVNSQVGTTYTLVLSDANKCIRGSNASAKTFTIPANASVAFPIGTAVTFVCDAITGMSIPITTDSMQLAGTASSGTRTLAPFGVATIIKVSATVWYISGSGLT